jgi:chromosome segregation ATPase
VRQRVRALLATATCVAVAMSVGCSKVTSCNVSPVEIEELREDVSVLDKDLAGVHERAQALADELAAKQADLDSKKNKPEELRRRLDLLKRGSGRIEKKTTGKDSKGAKTSDAKGKKGSS